MRRGNELAHERERSLTAGKVEFSRSEPEAQRRALQRGHRTGSHCRVTLAVAYCVRRGRPSVCWRFVFLITPTVPAAFATMRYKYTGTMDQTVRKETRSSWMLIVPSYAHIYRGVAKSFHPSADGHCAHCITVSIKWLHRRVKAPVHACCLRGKDHCIERRGGPFVRGIPPNKVTEKQGEPMNSEEEGR